MKPIGRSRHETLDYSPPTLKQLDAVIDDLRQRHGESDGMQRLLFSTGCYVGEVLVRHANARWRKTADVNMSAVASSPIVVQMPDGSCCNPIGKAYKRFKNGPEDSRIFLSDHDAFAEGAAVADRRAIAGLSRIFILTSLHPSLTIAGRSSKA